MKGEKQQGCFGPYGICVHVYGLTVGPDTRKDVENGKYQVEEEL